MRAVASSSPSAERLPPTLNLAIIAVRPHPALDAGVRVYGRIDDRDAERLEWRRGSSVPPIRFDLDTRRIADLPAPGDTVMLGDLRGMVLSSEPRFAARAARDLLARREHGRRELVAKLRRRGFSPPAVERAVGELEERGLQDERRFAREYIDARTRRRTASRMAVLAGLLDRGVERALAESSLSEWERENPGRFDDALDRAIAAMGGVDRATAVRRLVRRGFSRHEILRRLP